MMSMQRLRGSGLIQVAIRLVVILVLSAGGLAFHTEVAYADIRLVVKVTDCVTGKPIEGALVRVLTAAKSAGSAAKANTNRNGVAVIDPVRYGDIDHTVQASASGYQTNSESRYMKAWSPYQMDICLNPIAPPARVPTPTRIPTPVPVIPPTPVPPTITPTVFSTPDPLLICAQCGAYILKKIAVLLPLGNLGDHLVDLQILLRSTAAGGAIVARCKNDNACILNGMMVEVVKFIVKTALKLHPLGKIAVFVYDLIVDQEGLQECGTLSLYAWEMMKQLMVNGLNYTATAVHSPANILIIDAQGRRSGFLEDGSIVEEIPDSKVIFSNETKYIFLPSDRIASIDLKGTGDGMVTLDSLHSNGVKVQDATFKDFSVNVRSTAQLDFSGPSPLIILDPNGDGNTQVIYPSRYEELPVEAGAILPTAQPTSAPAPLVVQPALQVDAPRTGGGLGIAIILLLGGMGLMWVVVINSRRKRAGVPVAARIENPGRAHLQGESGAGQGRVVSLDHREIIIGRSGAADFVLADPMVSRQHARVVFSGNGWFLQDLGSKGGTSLNGRVIQASRLNSGDRIQIGNSTIVFLVS
jgi:hypothetical protein